MCYCSFGTSTFILKWIWTTDSIRHLYMITISVDGQVLRISLICDLDGSMKQIFYLRLVMTAV